MSVTIEPSSLSMASRILLGFLLLLNLLILLYLVFAEPNAERDARSDTVFPEGQKLVLIGELATDERLARAAAAEAPQRVLTENVSEEAPVSLSCQAWGPFANAETLDPARVAVYEVDQSLKVATIEVQTAPDFLVYLNSDDNLDNARRTLQELESQGIEAYVIAGGEYLNSVSAGVFSNRTGAEEVRQRLVDLGYAAEVRTLERSQEVSYLLGRVPEGFSVAGLESSPCEVIAQLQEFL